MTNANWWIGSNAQAHINLLEISVITLTRHLDGNRAQIGELAEFAQIENLSKIFIEGANQIRTAGRQEPKFRADMLRIFWLIETQIESLRSKTNIDLRNCQNIDCDICQY